MMTWLVWAALVVLALTAVLLAAGAVRRASTTHLWRLALGGTALAWGMGTAGVLSKHVATWAWQPETGLAWQTARASTDGWWALLALTAGLVALLTDAARPIRPAGEAWGWAALAAIGALSTVGALAGAPLAIVMAWIVLDLAALGADLGRFLRPKHHNTAVWVAFGRTLTWFLALVAVSLDGRSTFAGLLWWGALGLRLTVAAFQPAITRGDQAPWRLLLAEANLIATLRAMAWLVPAASLPAGAVATSGVVALWGAWRWQAARAPLKALTAGALAVGMLALSAAAQGLPTAALAWGLLAAMLPWGIALLPHRGRGALAAVALLAFPLLLVPPTLGSTAAALWQLPYRGGMGLLWLALAAIDAAVGWQAWAKPAASQEIPRASKAFCWLGFGLWIALLWAWPLSGKFPAAPALAWATGIAAAVAAAGWGWLGQRIAQHLERPAAFANRWTVSFLHGTFWGIYRLLRRALGFTSDLLEGEGGVLWAVVLLIMLAALLQH